MKVNNNSVGIYSIFHNATVTLNLLLLHFGNFSKEIISNIK